MVLDDLELSLPCCVLVDGKAAEHNGLSNDFQEGLSDADVEAAVHMLTSPAGDVSAALSYVQVEEVPKWRCRWEELERRGPCSGATRH